MNSFDLHQHPHTRVNILTGETVLVSPHRNKRPWQGKVEDLPNDNRPSYDPKCYLCPGNTRADGSVNEPYTGTYVFTNDFSALLPNTPAGEYSEKGLLRARSEKGLCRVISFSPDHSLTLPEIDEKAIADVINVWKDEYEEIASNTYIRYIQIFENKGEIMGCSNPHPHGQIWANESIPQEIVDETREQKNYFEQQGNSLLADYLQLEIELQERVVISNEHFVVLVPFWAVWPYETIIISRRHVTQLAAFTASEKAALANILKRLTIKYDNLFSVSFPYSAGIHQQPVNDGAHPWWHWHMHFYPPLLRSATVKKFMVGYEMLASPQRDITAETAAEKLRSLSEVHYKANL